MKFQSWNRFSTTALAVQPALMGRTVTFVHHESTVSIKVPSSERVGRDDQPLASLGSWHSKTGEPVYFHVHAVDVITACKSEVDLPDAVLKRHPNAFDDIDKDKQASLNTISEIASVVAVRAFDYWVSLLRWATGFHRICREVRVGSDSEWSTYLHDRDTNHPVWSPPITLIVPGVHTVTVEEWEQLQLYASAGDEPPIHIALLGDAKHCIDVGDYRRALVDLSVACEVYLRTAVVDSLPDGVLPEAVQLIEEANINQFISHIFPALLNDAARHDYKKAVKGDLSSLFAKRNKLMHVADFDGADHETCDRFRRALEALFGLENRGRP